MALHGKKKTYRHSAGQWNGEQEGGKNKEIKKYCFSVLTTWLKEMNLKKKSFNIVGKQKTPNQIIIIIISFVLIENVNKMSYNVSMLLQRAVDTSTVGFVCFRLCRHFRLNTKTIEGCVCVCAL